MAAKDRPKIRLVFGRRPQRPEWSRAALEMKSSPTSDGAGPEFAKTEHALVAASSHSHSYLLGQFRHAKGFLDDGEVLAFDELGATGGQ